MSNYGFSKDQWNDAKQEVRDILISHAKNGTTLSYSDLVTGIRSIAIEPHDQRLFQLLGDISTEEDAGGHGMLSVVVVHKSGDQQPGPGFFKLAKSLGRDTSDELMCWVDELKRVQNVWSEN